MRNKIIIAVMIGMLLSSGCGREEQIGYVDGARIMKSPAITKIREEGEQKLKEAEETGREEIGSKGTEEEKAKAQEGVERKIRGLQQAYATQIRQKIDVALKEIAAEKKVDVVIENSEELKTIISGGVDLTEEAEKKLQ